MFFNKVTVLVSCREPIRNAKTKMKYFLLIFVAICFSLTKAEVDQGQIELWESASQPYVEKCIKESSVKRKYVEGMKELYYPDDENFKSYLLCFYNSIGAFKSDHEVDVKQAAKALYVPEETVQKCSQVLNTKDTLPQKSYNFLICIVSKVQAN